MAWDLNQVVIVGRLTRDPEFQMLKDNTIPVCKFSIANNRGGTNNQDSVNFFDITAWNKTAELCNQYLHKGSQVLIAGTLKQSRFQDNNGQSRSKVEIVATNIQFLGKREDSSQYPSQPSQFGNKPSNFGGGQFQQNKRNFDSSGFGGSPSTGGFENEADGIFDGSFDDDIPF